jgi:hypothetical protein
MQLISAVLLSLVFLCAAVVHGVSPLYFHTHAIARIEARVEKIGTVQVPVKDSSEFLPRKSPETVTPPVDVQKISLRVLKVIEYIPKHAAVPSIRYGQIIDVMNPYADQVPSFKAGDKLKTRIRLVLPEEQFDPKDPRKQWWFYPEDAKEDIFPPRHPFRGVSIIK